jgi:hypothetical protein
MPKPQCCPICGAKNPVAVLKKWRFSAGSEDELHSLKGASAYGCENAHVFVVLPGDGDRLKTESRRNATSSDLIAG